MNSVLSDRTTGVEVRLRQQHGLNLSAIEELRARLLSGIPERSFLESVG